MRTVIACVCLLTLAACSSRNPTGPDPTPTATPTRIIRLSGNLDFGDVAVGSQRIDGVINISNDGNSTMTVSNITAPCGTLAYASTFLSGPIAPGATQVAHVRFAPTAVGHCSGTMTVFADHTSGLNTFNITGNGVNKR